MRKRKILQGLISVSSLISPLFFLSACNPTQKDPEKPNPEPDPAPLPPAVNDPGNNNDSQPKNPGNNTTQKSPEVTSTKSLNHFNLVQLDPYSRQVDFWFHAQNQKDLKRDKFHILLNDTVKVDLVNGSVSYGVYAGSFEVPNSLSSLTKAQLFYEDTTVKYHSEQIAQPIEFKTDKLGYVDFEITKHSNDSKKLEDIYPTDLKLADLEINVKGQNANLYNYNVTKFDYFVDQKGQNISDWLGALNLIITFTNKTNPSEVFTRSKLITGLKFNPIDGKKNNAYDKNDPQNHEHLNHDYVLYKHLNHQQRYEMDNVLYLNSLMAHLQFKGISPLDYRLDLNIASNKEAINNFDKKAKELGLDTYQSSYIKGFTLPKYDTNGEFLGLAMQAGGEIEKGPERADSIGRFQWRYSGLARTLVNEYYKTAAMQTYSVQFTNPVEGSTQSSAGTMWILDYQISEDGKYPTKWYFGTNLHVADNFTSQTRNVSIAKLKNNINFKLGNFFRTVLPSPTIPFG